MVRVCSSPKKSEALARHKQTLWMSIRRAPGFPHGFIQFWKQLPELKKQSVPVLPVAAPDVQTATVIFGVFQAEFTELERLLIAVRKFRARERREGDRNVIFRDVAKPSGLPIQSLVEEATRVVSEVSSDGLTVTIDAAWDSTTQPLFGPHGTLDFHSLDGREIQFDRPTHLEVGDCIRQEKYIGDVHEVFRSFIKFWESMWLRNAELPIETWDPFMQDLQARVPPAPGIMPYSPITVDEWTAAAAAKKVHTAAGPDGVSRMDLTRMPRSLVEQLVSLINRCETGQCEWPQVILHGHVSSLEKHSQAMSPKDYRPITVLSVVYRVYASI